MRRFFELEEDMTITNRWHLGQIFSREGHELHLYNKVPFTGTTPVMTEVTHIGRVLDFCMTSFAVPVATNELAKSVSDVAGTDVKVIALKIGGQLGMSILDAVRLVRCIDESRSKFTKWTKEDNRSDRIGDYHHVWNLTVDPQKIPDDANFFRIKGWEIALIVSDAVKEAMERTGCFGAKFTDVNLKD